MIDRNIDCSVLMLDIRNFTDNLFYYSSKKDDSFLLFLNDVFTESIKCIKKLSENNNFYVNSTGDGLLVIYFGDNHEIRCFTLGIMLVYKLTEIFSRFKEKEQRIISFGIGIESGSVDKVTFTGLENEKFTFLGNVINIASRIESETKNHARANLIIGKEINNRLVKSIFDIDYHELMNIVINNPDDKDIVHETITKMNLLNQKLLLSYIFEHNFKGLSFSMPLFRLSPTLIKDKETGFMSFLQMAFRNEKCIINELMDMVL